jgi:hypothetical protein
VLMRGVWHGTLYKLLGSTYIDVLIILLFLSREIKKI